MAKGDEAIWDEFKAGREEAFSYIYKVHINSLFNYGRRFITEKEQLKDILHEFFIDLWRTKRNLSSTNSIKNYLYKGFRNKILQEKDKRKRLPTDNLPHDYEGHFDFSVEQSLIETSSLKEVADKLNQALNTLSKRQKEAIHLKFYDHMSYREIAEIMGLNEQSVYNLIFAAIKVLRSKI